MLLSFDVGSDSRHSRLSLPFHSSPLSIRLVFTLADDSSSHIASKPTPLPSTTAHSVMCLFPAGGNVLIPPTERARKIGDYLRVAIALHFALAIFLVIGGQYVTGIFDILGALIGYYSIKNSEGYSFQCVLSYCVFCGMDVFWAFLRLILWFANATDVSQSGLPSWQLNVYIAGLIISPFVYIFATVASYYLYKELRHIMNESAGAMGDLGEMGGGGGFYGPSMAGNGGGGATWSHPETHPSSSATTSSSSSSSGGFKAFSGQGHRLG